MSKKLSLPFSPHDRERINRTIVGPRSVSARQSLSLSRSFQWLNVVLVNETGQFVLFTETGQFVLVNDDRFKAIDQSVAVHPVHDGPRCCCRCSSLSLSRQSH